MNIATNKLIANQVIREINLLQYQDWTAEERMQRIEVMLNALKNINQMLEDISLTDFNSRLHFSCQKGQIEHYLQICIAQIPQENSEEKVISDDFEPKIEETASSKTVIGMILFWVLFLLVCFLS